LRADGRFYQVDASNITLASGSSGKFFYRVRGEIKIVDDLTPLQEISSTAEHAQISVERIYDSGEPECVVCLEDPKTLVMVPLGYSY